MQSVSSYIFGNQVRPATIRISLPVMAVAKKVALIALSTFAWTLNASHFLLGFVAGATWAIITPTKPLSHCHSGGSCSDGVLETLTSVQLPDSIGLAAGTAILWTHLDHHPFPFVLLTGFYAGAYTGRKISQL